MLRLSAVLLGATLAVLTFAPAVRADSAAAEARFREGLQAMEAKDYATACPKLAESNRLDPASGTLLALALCYERAGKTASAWASYTDAAARSKLEKRADREKAARQKISELEPKLSKLTIHVSDEAKGLSGLSVKRDGEVVGAGSFDSPTPVNPGKHAIEVSADGMKPFSTSVDVGADADQKTVEVPALAKAEGAAPPPEKTLAAGSVSTSEASNSSLRTVGLIAGGAGVVALAVGTVFALEAKSKNNDANNDCSGNVCGDIGYSTRQDARSAGNVATVAFVAGGVLVATGVTLYLVGGPPKNREAAHRAHVELVPAVAPGVCGGFFSGAF